MDSRHPLTQAVEALARFLAEEPDKVRVKEERRDPTYLRLAITPGSGDNAGAIIGRGGGTITGIRSFLAHLAIERGVLVRIKVLTDDRQPAGGIRD